MQKTEFVPIFDKIEIAYTGRLVPRGSTAEERAQVMRVYYEILRDLPGDLVTAAAIEFMASPSAFPPTPGQLREKAVRLVRRGNKVPSAAEAWKEVMDAPIDGKMQRVRENTGPDKDVYPWIIEESPYQWSHPLPEKVARDLGWPDRFWTDNLTADRARFMNAYERALDYGTEAVTSPPEVTAYLRRSAADIGQLIDGFRRAALSTGEHL